MRDNVIGYMPHVADTDGVTLDQVLAENLRCDWLYPPNPQRPTEVVRREIVRTCFQGGMSAFAPHNSTIKW